MTRKQKAKYGRMKEWKKGRRKKGEELGSMSYEGRKKGGKESRWSHIKAWKQRSQELSLLSFLHPSILTNTSFSSHRKSESNVSAV